MEKVKDVLLVGNMILPGLVRPPINSSRGVPFSAAAPALEAYRSIPERYQRRGAPVVISLVFL